MMNRHTQHEIYMSSSHHLLGPVEQSWNSVDSCDITADKLNKEEKSADEADMGRGAKKKKLGSGSDISKEEKIGRICK